MVIPEGCVYAGFIEFFECFKEFLTGCGNIATTDLNGVGERNKMWANQVPHL
jgi:hypothetical protein